MGIQSDNQDGSKSYGLRMAKMAKDISEILLEGIDIRRLAVEREYIFQMQEGFIKDVLIAHGKCEESIVQIFFQFAPEVTPQLGQDEFAAGVCLENMGGWEVCEHNPSYIRDFRRDNEFLKWWYYEPIRMKAGGWTRPYFDPFLRLEVVTYSLPLYAEGQSLIGILGFDIDYGDFRREMNRRLVENIKSNVESIKKDYEFIGDPEALTNQYIDVKTYEIFNKDQIYGDLIIRSPEMNKVMELAIKAAISDANVLLQGETGVGKDFLAKYIHSKSPYASGPLININCCALPEGLLESEFFGYSKGSFTGAKHEGKAGYFEAANGGTILLNEIGDLPMHLQSKLLNVIQNKEVTRIGETLPRKTDFRLIAATNKDLYELVRQGLFREDLYYRIHVVSIQIPPLRERREDLYSLINLFFIQNLQKYKVERKLSVELISMLMDYDWPGNIRELENLIERIVVASTEAFISETDLPAEFRGKIQSNKSSTGPLIPGANNRRTVEPPGFMGLKELLSMREAEIICTKYAELGTSYKVAEALGISQSQAWQKIAKYVKK